MSDRSSREPGNSPRRAVTAGGLIGIATVLAVANGLYGMDPVVIGELLRSVQVGPWLVYVFAGAGIVGAVVAFLVVRYRLVSPPVVPLTLLAYGIYETWLLLRRPVAPLPGTPLDLVLVAWPLVLVGVLAVAGVEVAVRRRYRPADPA